MVQTSVAAIQMIASNALATACVVIVMRPSAVTTHETAMSHDWRLVAALRGLSVCRLIHAWSTGGVTALERAIATANTEDHENGRKNHPRRSR